MTNPNTLPEFPGYTVYRASTGDEICGAIHDGTNLYLDWLKMECGNPEKRKGDYLIQMGNGEMYRW